MPCESPIATIREVSACLRRLKSTSHKTNEILARCDRELCETIEQLETNPIVLLLEIKHGQHKLGERIMAALDPITNAIADNTAAVKKVADLIAALPPSGSTVTPEQAQAAADAIAANTTVLNNAAALLTPAP